jgi:ribonuclease D
MQALNTDIRIHVDDLPDYAAQNAHEAALIGWDIETSGLDWTRDKIATCQIFIPDFDVFLVQINGRAGRHPNLESLLCSERVRKVFHHAIFDLRFMLYHWDVTFKNVACTKIASKILTPLEHDHTLKAALQTHLGIHIDKDLGDSDWLRSPLTDRQVHYAAEDVIHLPILFEKLRRSLEASGRWELAQESFAYLPTRASLDILGAGDVFKYD